MSQHIFAEHFAAMCRFEDSGASRAAQLALVSRNGNSVVDALVSNHSIHPEVVDSLIATKLRQKTIGELIHRFSSRNQFELFLAKERRDGVLAKAVRYLDDELASRALSVGGVKTAAAIASARHLSPTTRLAALGKERLEAAAIAQVAGDISDPELLNDDVVWSKLHTATMPAKMTATLRTALHRMYAKRPALLTQIEATSPKELILAAAGSPSITADVATHLSTVVVDVAADGNKWPLLAAIANPRFDAESFRGLCVDLEEMTKLSALEQIHWRSGRPQIQGRYDNVSIDQLPWLKRRAFASDNNPARPAELLEVITHPALGSRPNELLRELLAARRAFPVFAPDFDVLIRDALTLDDIEEELREWAQSSFGDTEEDFVVADHDVVLNDEQVCTYLNIPLERGNYYYGMPAFCTRAEQLLGDDQERWDTLWALLDQVDPSTTFGELIDMSSKL